MNCFEPNMMNRLRSVATAALVLALSHTSTWAGVYEDMIHAIKNGKEQEVAALLKRGVDPDTATPEGETLLMLAIKEGKLSLVQTVVAAKPRINARNAHGETALMLAALRGDFDVVRLLLERGAEGNQPGR